MRTPRLRNPAPALIIAAIGVLALTARAATPLASVSSAESFRLNGVRIPVEGVPSWPLVGGDDVATSGASAVILFPDRSRVTLDKNSRARLSSVNGRVELRLVEGQMSVNVATRSGPEIYTPSGRVQTRFGSETAVTVKGVLKPVAAKPPPPPPPPGPSPISP